MTNVANPFVQSMASNFDQALRLMEAALTDCPDELWETDLWPDEAPTAPTPHGGLHGSAPWFLAYHALTTLDYDLSAELEPWEPPRPFDENTYVVSQPSVHQGRAPRLPRLLPREGAPNARRAHRGRRRRGRSRAPIDTTACCTA